MKTINITSKDIKKEAHIQGIKLPRGLKEWKKSVKRYDCDSRILKKLEELGHELRFADSGPYVDCENKLGKYRTNQCRLLTLDGKALDSVCDGLNKEYPVYVRNAEIEHDGKYHRTYLRIYNDKL